jgi:hypothetical protein
MISKKILFICNLNYSFEEKTLKNLFLNKLPGMVQILKGNSLYNIETFVVPNLKMFSENLVEKFKFYITKKQTSQNKEITYEKEISSAKVIIFF